ncbi:MAG: ABC transporter permease [Gammaproteobacteria bacterium]|jgi:ABC-type lipoprotein release transport system permease subunit|nr:ABC transporter permease [Gammaproteobacteria bacterium]MBT4605785.1 ABC transporter permease [Thiotrichales bacterium]MBT3473312.1 ABC transporter permease [Gammaproteobacteria bacterium]MBT3967746.1 ABC transporter permease [Gammaproteobacteria bacterium]MBT4079338.1 ABC transporter permease [Gammaproteobacteria bacterium]
MILSIAWRNLWRNPARSLLTLLALSGGLLMLLLNAALLEGMKQQMERSATALTTSPLQIHRQAFIDSRDLYATLPWVYLDQLSQRFPLLKMAPRLYADGLASSEQSSAAAMIRAVDPVREVAVSELLRHLRSGEAKLERVVDTADGTVRDQVLIGTQMAKQLLLHPGDELILVTQAADGSIGNGLFQVAGVLKPIDPGFDRSGVLMSIAAYQELMVLEQGVHELAVQAPADALLQARIEQQLIALAATHPLDKLGGAARIRNWRELTPAVADIMEMSSAMMGVIGAIIITLASLGMVNTMMMSIHERTHEFGILLAIGMSRWRLLGMVLLESLLLALLAALCGSLLGSVLGLQLERHGIDFSAQLPDGYDWGGMVFEPVMNVDLQLQHIWSGSLMMITITLIAALIPAWRTLRLKPVEVLG